MNWNVYILLCIHYFNTVLNCNVIYMWFNLFMLIIILQVTYNSTMQIYNKNKGILIIIIYLFLYYIITLLFLSEDCIFFIINFETMLFSILVIAMYFIFNNRFIIAIYYLIIFSIFSGLLCFIALFIIFININITGYLLYINALILNNLTILIFLWSTLYVIFGIKYPIYPFYFWLLAVHVEVSTEMSTVLAGIILKSGFIGILKFIIVMCNAVTLVLSNIILIIIIIGLFACSINLLIITDYKKIVASWSVLHLNITLLFIWYNNLLLLLIFILSNLGHIISSSSFFLCISFNYENFNNKHIFMISSCFNFNIVSFLIIFLILNNIDFPFFLLFYVELINFFAIIFISNYLLLLLGFIVITLFVSSLLIYFTLNYYNIKWNNKYIRFDITINEYLNILILIIYSIILYWWLSLFFI
jgi:NADH:ubiquinone oxidoreductase subunit 4 (subunit M)